MPVEKKDSAMSISDILKSIRDGGCMEELGDALRQVSRAVNVTGKPGRVSLTLMVTPNGQANAFVKDKVVATVPRGEIENTLYFVDEDGNLSRQDPRQMRLVEEKS